ncbi:MAG: PD-(D/E)XK nuclease family protein [Flavobacteriaceae bacterium]
MQSFIEKIVKDIIEKHDTIADIIFVLPSKRAGTFLKNTIAKTTAKTIFSPEIYSIEEFVEKISGISYASNTQQLFELYRTYLDHIRGEKDSFFSFCTWGQTLLQDFNEIDRHLIDPSAIFSNLSAILEINHWSPENERTQMMEDYLRFWKHLEVLYHNFNKRLLTQGLGHQGLVYRQACDALGRYQSNNLKTHVFMGFNALNTAENHIIQSMLSTSKADIYWDIDTYFLNDPIHDAAYFIRKYKNSWSHFKTTDLKGISSNYSTSDKNINIIGVPKNISQAKYIGNLLKKLHTDSPKSLENTAVVLSDEALLNPIINSIPKEIEAVNITMGYPLRNTPLASVFNQFLELYTTIDTEGWHYQKLLVFLAHPFVNTLLRDEQINTALYLSQQIKKKNLTHIGPEKLQSLTRGNTRNIALLFFKNQGTPLAFVERCLTIISELRLKTEPSENSLTLEYLYRFNGLFNQILDLINEYDFITDIKSLSSLYKELLSSETLNFQGDPLDGLQIMGMLESRNLDFETIIISSVNEGILPSGKSNNSFIPFDLKTGFGLPTYKDKDAVYTYHFYRLLQRAKNIYILYNTEPDVLEGGEKSRLITQMLTDENISNHITEIIAAPEIRPTTKIIEIIAKDVDLIQIIKNHANKGFSPSSLSNYIRNPIDFYKQNLLRIDDILAVEDSIASNTFGTILHDTLEDLYRPVLRKYLTEESLIEMKTKIKHRVSHHFSKSYSDGTFTKGKNLIAFNVILKYIENFIGLEIEEVRKHQIKIIGLEEKLKLELDIPGIDFPVFLKGKLDRIDEIDGSIRIIDYKTGKVVATDVEIVDWQEITADYSHSKAFQLLCYALMYNDTHFNEGMEAGIISFKNLSSGLLKFATKDKKSSRIKNSEISPLTLELFQTQLSALILEICNANIPFTEKEI